MEYKRKLDGTADMRCVKKKTAVEESLGWVDNKELPIRTIETGKGSLLPDPAKRGLIQCRDRQVNIRHCLFGYKLPDTSSNLSEAAIFTSTRPILSFAICTNDVICTVVTKALLCGEDGTWPPYYFDLRHGEGLSNTAIHAVANKAADLFGNDGKVIMCKEITPVIQMMAEGLRRTVCQPTTALLVNEKETVQEFRFAVKNFAQEVNLRSPLALIKETLLNTLDANRLLVSGLDSTGPGLWKYDQTVYVTGAGVLTASSHMSLRTEQAVHVSLSDSGVAVDAIVRVVRLLKGELGREEEWGDMPYFKPDATIGNTTGQEVVSDDEADQRSDQSELSFLATTLPNLADGFGSDASAPRGMSAGPTVQSAQRITEVMSEEDRLRIQIATLNAKKAQSVNRLAQLASTATFAPSRPTHNSTPEVVDLFSTTGESSSDPPPPLRVRAVSLGQPPSSTDTTATFITNPYSSNTGGLARAQSAGTGVLNTTSHTTSLPQWMQEIRDTRRQPTFTSAQSSVKPVVVPISPTAAPYIRRSSYKAPSTPTDSGRDSETEVAKPETVEPPATTGTTTNIRTPTAATIVSTAGSASGTTTTPTSAVNTSGSTNTTTPSTTTSPITTTVTTNITPPPITTPTTMTTTFTTTSITNTTITTTATPITTPTITTNTPPVATKRTTTRAQKVAQTHDGDNSHSDSSTTDPLTTGQPTPHKRPSIQSSWVKVKKRIVPFGSGVPVGGGSSVSVTPGSTNTASTPCTNTTVGDTSTTTPTAPVTTTTITSPTTATPSTTHASDVITAHATTTTSTPSVATSSPATTTHTATAVPAATPSTSGITPIDINTPTTSTTSSPVNTTITSTSTSTTLHTTTNTNTTTPTIDSMLAQYDDFPLKVPNIKEEVVLKDEVLPLTTPPITPYTSLFTPSNTTTQPTNTTSTPPTRIIHTYHAVTNIHMYTNSAEATERLVDFVEFSLSEQLQHDLHHLATPVVVHRGVTRPAVMPAGAVVCVELNTDTLSVGEFYNSVRGQLGLG